MNQAELQLQAEERIKDASALIKEQRWSFAYYVAGYAVECALKSAVLQRMTLTGSVFKDKKFAEKCFTHKFEDLVDLAGLRNELHARFAVSTAANDGFVANWGVACAWTESSRYEFKAESEARALYNTITDATAGVLPWIKNYW